MSNILKWDYSKPDLYEFGKATGWNGEVELFANRLDIPLHWRKPRRIFICSMSDLFHPKVPFEFIDKVMFTIYRSYKLEHTFQILTKRVKRMQEYFSGDVDARILELFRKSDSRYTSEHRLTDSVNMLPRVWLGVSISNQADADEKIPILLQIPAAVRWLSVEPMLGGISLDEMCKRPLGKKVDNFQPYLSGSCLRKNPQGHNAKIDWVVVGCESGPKRRPFSLTWAESIVEQCKAASVPVFVKQIIANFGKVVKMPKGFPQEYPINS